MHNLISNTVPDLLKAKSVTEMRRLLQSMSNDHRRAFFALPSDIQRAWKMESPKLTATRSAVVHELERIWLEARSQFFKVAPNNATNRAIFDLCSQLALNPWTNPKREQLPSPAS